MKRKIRKAVIFTGVIGLIVIPLTFMVAFGKRNSMYKETAGYMEYLYFNWIDYPKKADKTDIFPEDVNKEVFGWFGYD